MIDFLHMTWTTACELLGDALLGWLLYLQRDLALLALAALTAGLLLLLRRCASDQQSLSRLQHDNRRLAQCIRDARRRGDRDALRRYRKTRFRVAHMRIAAEARLALISIVPLAGVVSWGAARLQYVPPHAGESLEFVVQTPASAAGELIHLVPNVDIKLKGGWIRELELVERAGRPRGRASWSVVPLRPRRPLRLTARLKFQTLEHPVLIGARWYAPPVLSHGGDLESLVRLEVYRPLGGLPGLAGLAPWMVAYVALVVGLFYGVKRLLRLH
jgi:hypothetical protein